MGLIRSDLWDSSTIPPTGGTFMPFRTELTVLVGTVLIGVALELIRTELATGLVGTD